MLDVRLIRKDPDLIEKKLKTKDRDVNIKNILKLDEKTRELQAKSDELKAKRNQATKIIAERKKKLENTKDILEEMTKIADEITKLDIEHRKIDEEREELLANLPNIPMDDIPVAYDPKDNKCIKTYLEKPAFDFPFKNHIELNESLNLFDFERGAKISGTGFIVYKEMGAKLEWALLNYMLDIHRQNGYAQIIPPILVKDKTMYGSAQLPKFKDQSYKIKDEDQTLYVVPTSEVSLNGLYQDEIIDEGLLPIKMVSYTPCFRKEAGAHGKQERGLIRTHQFNKVELFCLSVPENSEKVFEMMLLSAEEVLKGLNLHYRNMLLCTSDMSFAAAKTVDIEVYLPGQGRYYEVSSVSNCTDFQSRRSNIKCKIKEEKPRFLHTLNGSGVATSRLMVALLENNQQKDGSVIIPTALRKYLDDQKYLKPNI